MFDCLVVVVSMVLLLVLLVVVIILAMVAVPRILLLLLAFVIPRMITKYIMMDVLVMEMRSDGITGLALFL
jgi:hypothetical protein